MPVAVQAVSDARLREAYQHCRQIARQRARNFYYAFVALPPAKRDAICAVYAFMRRADDIADGDAPDARSPAQIDQPVAQRRIAMQQWLAAWKLAEAGHDTDDITFLALRDAQQRFQIPGQWLDQLVQGTTLDLDEMPTAFATFDDLYRYCYLVASVVGLVCIRIFGYDDPRAEQLAEETGIAFQLTNILRDVAEDAAMGRVYLPDSDLKQHGLTRGYVLRHAKDGATPQTAALLQQMAARAEHYYASADELLPLIHRDSRPALRVLVRIYHRLLQRIKSSGYDVFSEKISVPPVTKLAILAQGLLQVAAQRVFRVSQ
jgi:phytoene synthase